LQKEKELFTDQEKKIEYLETRIAELTNLIKTQKEKIINTFLNLFAEKELLQKLITIHLEFTKAKKQNLSTTRKYRKEFNMLYEKLEES